MSRTALGLALSLAIAATAVPQASGWEAATTHAGLTEETALASKLHQRLREQFGVDAGLMATLTVPPADAPGLFEVLRRLSPTHGYVPDARGGQSALSWLVAGSVVADVPARFAANHFYSPTSESGLSGKTLRGVGKRLRHRIVPALFGGEVERKGAPAPDWLLASDNPLGWQGFAEQYRKAVSAATAPERERALAGALVAAGAMLHILQDMGSPSHVRDDLAAHLERLGDDPDDVGSRFEHLAALAYGRLGVPKAGEAPGPRPLRAFVTAADGSGLADRIATSYFSAGTLPGAIAVQVGDGASAVARVVAGSLRRPAPAPTAPLDLMAARNPEGATARDERGVCLARYRVVDGKLRWHIDDACALEQLGAILPTVGGYGVGFLDTLFRGTLALEQSGRDLVATTTDLELGKGRVTAYFDDARGVRKQYASGEVAAGAPLAIPAPPTGAATVAVLFDGVDAAGQPLLAAATSTYPIPTAPAKPD